MPKITLLSDLIYLHFHAKLFRYFFFGPGNKNHVFSTFTVRLKAVPVVSCWSFFISGVSRETTAKTNRDNNKLTVCIIWKCLRISLCYYLIFSFSPFAFFFWSKFLGAFVLRADGGKEKRGKKKNLRKNYEKMQKTTKSVIITCMHNFLISLDGRAFFLR